VTGTTVTSPAFVGTPPTGVFGTSPLQLGPNTFTFFDPRAVRASSMPEWFATTRVRVGYAMDRVLVFATGGLAVGGGYDRSDVTTVATHAGNLTVANGSCWRSDKCSDARWGWVLGGGVEYAVTNSLSAKIEGLYADLGRRTENYGSPAPLQYAVMSGVGVAGGPASDRIVFTAPAGAFSPKAERLGSSFVVLRAGLNYRFTGL
jgi:opacity protein-like surface antigen